MELRRKDYKKVKDKYKKDILILLENLIYNQIHIIVNIYAFFI